jgi:hypothetical protein
VYAKQQSSLHLDISVKSVTRNELLSRDSFSLLTFLLPLSCVVSFTMASEHSERKVLIVALFPAPARERKKKKKAPYGILKVHSM